MAREHIEFIQSQNVAWEPAAAYGFRREASVKCFSADPETGALTALLHYPPGVSASAAVSRRGSEELFVLDGELTVNGRPLRRHHYAYVPPDAVVEHAPSPSGALVLTCCNGGFEDLPAAGSVSVGANELTLVDSYGVTWDATVLDPKLSHLRLSRKILRAAADASCRTYLLAGLPHGRPADGRLQLERHPHDEEMFLISGDMSCPQGVMRPGAYFYRPREIVHGPHFSDLGFFMFMRNPGTNVSVRSGHARPAGDRRG
jgi:hypothetical protein